MARVPQAQPAGALGAVAPTQGPAVFDSTRASEAFGASPSRLGEAVSGIGDAISEQALVTQIQDNDRAYKLGVIELNRQRTDSDKAFYELEGDNAVNGVDDAFENLSNGYDEFVASQENESVRDRLFLYSEGDKVSASARYETHVRKERENAEQATQTAILNSIEERVGVDPRNFSETELHFFDIASIMNDSFDRQGVLLGAGGKDQRLNEIKRETGKAVVAGFNTVFTTEGVDAAEEWLERPLHVDNIPSTVIDNLRQRIITGRGKNTSVSLNFGRNMLAGIKRGDGFSPEMTAETVLELRKIDSIVSNDLADNILLHSGAQEQVKGERALATTEQIEEQVALDSASPVKESIEESVTDNLRATMQAAARTEIARGDALDVYSRDKEDPITPIDFTDRGSLATRKAQAEVASESMGFPVPPIRSDEIDELGQMLLGEQSAAGTVTNAEQAVEIMQNLQIVYGPQQAGAIANELDKKANNIAVALLLSNADPATAEQIVRGGRIKAEGDRTAMLPSPTQAATAQELALPGYFNKESNRDQAAIHRAAEAIYLEANPNLTIYDERLYGEALNKVIGGGLEHEGNAISPPALGYTQRRLDHLLSSLDDTMIDPLFIRGPDNSLVEWSVEEFDQFWFDPAVNPQLKSLGLLTGKYTIQNPNGDFILNSEGNPAILDLGEIERRGLIPLEQSIGIDQPTGRGFGGLNRSIQAHEAAIGTQTGVLQPDQLPVNTERNVITPPPSPVAELDFAEEESVTIRDNSLRQIFGSDLKQQAALDRIKRKENDARVGRNSTTGRWSPHNDSLGNPTIGYGHLVTKEETKSGTILINGVPVNYKKDGLTDQQVDDLLRQDLEKHASIARSELDNWNSFNHVRKTVAAELAFMLGEGKFSKFKNASGTGTLDLMDKFQFVEAARSLSKNKKLKAQVGIRLDELIVMLATGRMQ